MLFSNSDIVDDGANEGGLCGVIELSEEGGWNCRSGGVPMSSSLCCTKSRKKRLLRLLVSQGEEEEGMEGEALWSSLGSPRRGGI